MIERRNRDGWGEGFLADRAHTIVFLGLNKKTDEWWVARDDVIAWAPLYDALDGGMTLEPFVWDVNVNAACRAGETAQDEDNYIIVGYYPRDEVPSPETFEFYASQIRERIRRAAEKQQKA